MSTSAFRPMHVVIGALACAAVIASCATLLASDGASTPTVLASSSRQLDDDSKAKIKLAVSHAGRTLKVSKGYFEQGDSLVGAPIVFHSRKGDETALAQDCHLACVEHPACAIYTFNLNSAKCYLKAKSRPVRGRDCTHDCWYHGRVDNPPLMSLTIRDASKDLGLKVHDVKVGRGQEIKKNDEVVMKYVGKLDDGTVFDSGKYVFNYGQGMVITGDDIGLAGMRVGGERRLTIPPVLGYGYGGYPCSSPCVSIPSDATLHFDVTIDRVSGRQLSSGYKE